MSLMRLRGRDAATDRNVRCWSPRKSFPIDSRLKCEEKYPAFYVTDASETESG